MATKVRIRVDARKVRRLRDDLSRLLGMDVSQEYVADRAGINRALISYMENPKSRRRFSFETVFLLARFYREALKDPHVTCEFLARESDRFDPKPHLAEDPATYKARQAMLESLYDKVTDLSEEQLSTLSEYLDFLLVQQRHNSAPPADS